MTTPRAIASKLVKYSRKHPELDLSVFEIPQVPGYRRQSGRNKSVAASLMTTGYAIPIAVLNPYLFGAIFVDYVARGRYPVLSENPVILAPEQLAELSDREPVGPSPEGPAILPGEASTITRQPVGPGSGLNPGESEMTNVVESHE
jgi:hypothetical protein